MYVTYKLQDTYKQTIFDFEYLYNNFGLTQQAYEKIPGKNVTIDIDDENANALFDKYNLGPKIEKLKMLAEIGENLPKDYERFYIPKKTGGLREINAPNPALSNHLRLIKDTFENEFFCLSHNSAYAYIKNRCTVDALKVHKDNESKWFLKLDIKNFFPNCNPAFIMSQLTQIFPFSIIEQKEPQLLSKLIEPGILNNGLPQGTPLSPFLTNIIMTPIDYAIERILYSYNQYFIYTRYADDIIISSKYDFDWRKIQNDISTLLQEKTPFTIKEEKTRYGSSSGRNWNLGLMLNKDNNITVGYRKKERCRAMIFQFMNDYKQGNYWNKEDIQNMTGIISYYKMVEPVYFTNLINKYNKKFNLNFNEITKI